MKKRLSLILAIVMTALAVITAVPVYAETGTYDTDDAAGTAGYYFRVAEEGTGTQYYNALSDAIAAAADGGTVYAIKSGYEFNGMVGIEKDLTIKGVGTERVSIKFTGMENNASFNNEDGNIKIKNASVKIENMSIDAAFAAFYIYGNTDLWIYNSYVMGRKNSTVGISGIDNVVTVEESQLERARIDKDGGSVIFTRGSGDERGQADIYIISNSTLTTKSSVIKWQPNNSVIAFNGYSAKKDSSLTVDATSTLENALVDKVEGMTEIGVASIIAVNSSDGAKFNVTLNSGAILKAASPYTTVGFKFINNVANYGKLTVDDQGALYIATPDALKNGVTLPKTATGNTYDVNFKQDGTVAADTAYTKANSDNDYVFTNTALAVPAIIMQDRTEAANGKLFRVGTSYYADFAEAQTAANGTAEICMLTNVTFDSELEITAPATVNARGLNLILKNGLTVSNTQNVSIKNANLKITAGITVEGASLTLTKVKSEIDTALIAVEGTGNNIVMDGCTVAAKGTKAITFVENASAEIKIEDSNITAMGEAKSQGNSIIDLSGATTSTVEIAGSSVLALAYETAQNGNIGGAIITDEGATGAATTNTVKLKDTATLTVDTAVINAGAEYIYDASNNKTIAVDDNGASYTATIRSLGNGVKLPADGGKKVNYYVNWSKTDIIESGSLYKNASTIEDVTFTKVIAQSNTDMYNVKGASIRTDDVPSMKFTALISKSFYNSIIALDENAEFGIAIGVVDRLVNGSFENSTRMHYKAIAWDIDTAVETEDGYYIIRGGVFPNNGDTVIAATKEGYETKIMATAYYKTEDGIVFADYNSIDNSRSLYDLAKAYYEDTTNGSTESAAVNAILEACGYFG